MWKRSPFRAVYYIFECCYREVMPLIVSTVVLVGVTLMVRLPQPIYSHLGTIEHKENKVCLGNLGLKSNGNISYKTRGGIGNTTRTKVTIKGITKGSINKDIISKDTIITQVTTPITTFLPPGFKQKPKHNSPTQHQQKQPPPTPILINMKGCVRSFWKTQT